MKYYKKDNCYLATDTYGGINVIGSGYITTTKEDYSDWCIKQGYSEITHEEFCKAYKQTRAMLDSAFSRLNMMYTDANIDKATEADKEEERERFQADDVHRGEHMEFEC
jgi:hypothetical protein